MICISRWPLSVTSPTTLRFDLADAIAKLSFSPFTLATGHAWIFQEAGVVWIGTQVKRLSRWPTSPTASRALLDQKNVVYDRRPLAPHMTLLRGVKGFAAQKIAPIRWRIDSIALYRSTRAQRPAYLA